MNVSKVSVVMCTFNGAAFIKEQLDSIIAQTYPLFELLIFDDASTDDTYTILEEYGANNPKISIHKNPHNIGFAANFKQALLAAAGDVIAIADQDDIWVLSKIEKMMQQWDHNALLIYCDSIRFKDSPPINPSPDPKYKRFEGKDARKIFLFNTVSGHAILIKKELLSLALPFADNIFYDWWLAVVAAYNGGVNYVNEVLVFQRVHGQNVSVGDGLDHTQKEQRKAFKKMVLKHLEEFQKAPQILPEDKKFVEKFKDLLYKSLHTKFYLQLFFFMFKNRRLLFNHKKKKNGFFSYSKYAYRMTYNYDL